MIFGWIKPRKAAQPPAPKKKAPPIPKVPFPIGYTLAEFRQNIALCNSWRDALHGELGRHVLAAMLNGAPRIGEEVNPTSAAIALGKSEGYHMAIQTLQDLTMPITPAQDLPDPDYGETEILAAEGLDIKED